MAVLSSDGKRLAMGTTAAGQPAIVVRDVASGQVTHTLAGHTGPVLALADLVAELAHDDHHDVLVRAAHALAATRPSSAGLLPGLYVGEAGVGAALLRAGQVLGDDHLIRSALAQGRLVASVPYASPDMYNGTAGRLRFHLLLWDATSEKEALRHATEAAAALLRNWISIRNRPVAGER